MQSLDIDITVGGCLPIKVPVSSADYVVINGGGIVAGWTLRDASSDIPANASGNVVAPGAGATIAQLTGLAAGTYTINWSVGLQGAAAAADSNNFQLFDTAGNVIASVNPGAAGDYPQAPAQVTIAQGNTIGIKAIGAGTAGVTYSADLDITPAGLVETVVEIQDGNNILGEVGFSYRLTDSAWFGSNGPIFFGNVTVHIISGVITGSVYIIPSRSSQ